MSADLIASILDAHERCERAERDAKASGRHSVLQGKRAGDLLLAAKDTVGHGSWTAWKKTNCPTIHERALRRYQFLAEYWSLIGELDRLSNMTMSGAISRIQAIRKADPTAVLCRAALYSRIHADPRFRDYQRLQQQAKDLWRQIEADVRRAAR